VDVKLYAFVISVLKNRKWSAPLSGEGERNIYSVLRFGGPVSTEHGGEGENFCPHHESNSLVPPALLTAPSNYTGSYICGVSDTARQGNGFYSLQVIFCTQLLANVPHNKEKLMLLVMSTARHGIEQPLTN
jgi:hypothetical protein